MNAIILKELRENVRWAFLIFLGIAAVLAFGCSNQGDLAILVSPYMHSLCGAAFSCAGFSLGLLQLLQDQRRGRWEFLTHRPIPRRQIFLGKLIVGAALYLLVTSIPLAAVILWISTPGNVPAPFDWHMALPRISDLIGGLVWYVTGLLVAARRVRWIGSRLAPMGLAFLVSFIASDWAWNLTEATLIDIAGILVLLFAAWTTFVAAGNDLTKPLLVRFLQTISVGPGIAMALFAAASLVISLLMTLFHPGLNDAASFYSFRPDGQIIQGSYDNQGAYTFTDLQGRPITGVPAKDLENSQLIGEKYLQLGGFGPDDLPSNAARIQYGFQNSAVYVQPIPSGQRIQWFYVVARRTIEGFFRDTAQYAGSLGPDGFVPPTAPPHPFPEPVRISQPGSNAISPSNVYSLYLDDRTVLIQFQSTPDDPIINAGWFDDNNMQDSPNDRPVVITRSSIHYKDNQHPWRTIPLEHHYPEYRDLEAGWTTAGHFMVRYMPPVPTDPNLVVETDESGNIIRRTELPALPSSAIADPAWLTPILLTTMPPALSLSVYFVNHYDELPSVANAHLVESIFIGILSAIAGFLILRRRQETNAAKLTWAAISLIMGPSGLLMMWSLRPWPAMLPCPKCQQPRSVAEELCPNCRAAFNPPAAEGIEILQNA